MKKCISLALVAMSMLAMTACTNKNETNNEMILRFIAVRM